MTMKEIIRFNIVKAAQDASKLMQSFAAPTFSEAPIYVTVDRINDGYAIKIVLIPQGRWAEADKPEAEAYFGTLVADEIICCMTGRRGMATDATAEFDGVTIEPIVTLKMTLKVED